MPSRDRPDTTPTAAEIAALTARLRSLSHAGAAADPAERARFLADKDALLDRISADVDDKAETVRKVCVAAETGVDHTADGQDRDPGQVHGANSELGLTGGEGPVLDARPALTAEEAAHALAADGRTLDEARALVHGYLDDVSERVGTSVHHWGLDQADLDDIRGYAMRDRAPADGATPTAAVDDEQERRDELNRWHATSTDEPPDADELAHTDEQE